MRPWKNGPVAATPSWSRKDNQVTFDAVLDELKIRDGLDITRSASPLKPADDALIIDTEGRSPEEVAQLLIDYASSTAA